MIGREALQLGAALLFPLGLVSLLLASVAAQRGRTRGQILGGVAAIVACVAVVMGIGLALSASRGGPLLDYGSGGLGVGVFRPVDALGVVACVALLGVALMVAKWLIRAEGELSA